MPKPTDPEQHAYMFSDDMKFSQKIVLFHPEDEKKFLTIQRSQEERTRPGAWDLPGGNVLYGQSHSDALTQEIEEETGLKAVEVTPVQVLSMFDEKTPIYYLFIGYKGRAVGTVVTISHEHDDYQWVTPEEFYKLESAEFLINLVKTVYS